jgi:hypothetical protein
MSRLLNSWNSYSNWEQKEGNEAVGSKHTYKRLFPVVNSNKKNLFKRKCVENEGSNFILYDQESIFEKEIRIFVYITGQCRNYIDLSVITLLSFQLIASDIWGKFIRDD